MLRSFSHIAQNFTTFLLCTENKVLVYTPLKLFVVGFDKGITTYGQIHKMFPKASTILGPFEGDAALRGSRTLAAE